MIITDKIRESFHAAILDRVPVEAPLPTPAHMLQMLEEHLFLLDDAPGLGAPERYHEAHLAEVADSRHYILELARACVRELPAVGALLLAARIRCGTEVPS